MDDLPDLAPHEGPEALTQERRARALLAHVAAEAGAQHGVEGVLSAVLSAVCHHTGWPLAHCYMQAPDGALHSARLWFGADDPRFRDFVERTEALHFPAGVGLPGRVLASGRPAWITDAGQDTNFPRAPVYQKARLGAAFAFPVRADGDVFAVLEFFANTAQPPDAALLEVLLTIGVVVGHLVQRRRGEAALRASEGRFRAIAATASDAIIAADAWGRITFWSAAAERMLGHRAESMMGEPLERIVPPELREAHAMGLARLRTTGVSRLVGRAVEVPALRADGSLVPTELTLGTGGEGDELLFTAVLRDVTERKLNEARLREQSEELRRQHAALARSHAELVEAQHLMERIFSAYSEILPGTVLDGRYRLDEAIGSGGFGVVYRGVQLTLERPVAIKLFRPAGGRVTPDALRRFLAEGPNMVRVRHAHAVAVLDAGVSADGLPYLVMELLEGETLAARLSREPLLPLDQVARIGAALAGALAAVHEAGLAHRDIKPENIFLHRHEGAEIPKLVDFGIARLLETTLEDRLTQTGHLIGTPAWLPPERLEGAAGDARSDVWSLGAILFRALAGRNPFSWANPSLWSVLADTAPPSLLARGLPPAFDALLQRVLSPAPDQRPDAASLARTLRELAPDLPSTRLGADPDAQLLAQPTVELTAGRLSGEPTR